jgi:YVTN family beta-propeller protein
VSVSRDSRIGTELIGYRIEELLGRGGMGVVYRAYDLRLKRNVALKLVAPELSGDEHFRERFLRETELAASLEHPNVVPVHDAGQVDSQLYLAMRYVEGADLKTLLRREGILEPPRALAIFGQVAGALDAAHARGLVHRDVKPSNVLLDAQEHAYLADFGLTRRLAEQSIPGEYALSLGTPAYVAPEQVRGDEVDGRTDLYSLACVLYECLTGQEPFSRESDLAMLWGHLEEPPPKPSEARPELPQALDGVMEKALAKNPEERYQSGAELVEAAIEAFALAAAPRERVPLTLVVPAVTAIVVGAGLLAFFLMRGGGRAPAARAGVVVRIDPATNRAADTISVGEGASAVAASASGIWVAAYRSGTLWRVNPRTLVATQVTANGAPQDVAISGGNVYVAGNGPTELAGNVTKYALLDGRRLDALQLPSCVSSIAAGAAGIWATPCPRITLLSFGAKPKVLATIDPPRPPVREAATDLETLNDAAVGYGAVWVLGDALYPRLWRIDPQRARIVKTTVLPFAPSHVATGAGAVWVTDQLDDRLARVDPATGKLVALIRVGRGASGVAVGAGSVWVANSLDGTVSRINPHTNRLVAAIEVTGSPKDVAVGEGSVWTAADAG